MINRQALLSDLQSLLKKLEADLLERSKSSDVPEVGKTLREEYARAKKAERTALNYETWRSDAITQTAAAWVLSCVFVRFLEDNALIDPPKIAGPGKRLQQARDEHILFFQDPERAKLTDREYLVAVFDQLADLPGTRDVFGQHNPLRQLPNWLGPDAAGELLKFFQKIDANSGELIHDFTDPDWNTRFLGDLYQDLSEAARKKYALLQTPDFVEEFILDRTLEPALDEFGLDAKPEGFKMIDPACGSGHFLLGAFKRILARWQKQEPGTKVRELVGRALLSVHGVDVNPFAIAIARFRLLLAAMQAEGIKRLGNSPGYEFRLAIGDSLFHGRAKQKTLGDWTDEAHYFATEDAAELRQILRSGTYHCVVANPPYITPKDRAAGQAYRQLYPETCHMQYSLAVPFMELLFRLASNEDPTSGYIGQITANSFMKREFGKKLIESFFPKIDLTHVIDTSGAFVPGHGTPTVILLGRNRIPKSTTIRTAMGIRGEPSTPDDPAKGMVWTAILKQLDQADTESDFISVRDSERELFHSHPWSIGGGGAAELRLRLEDSARSFLQKHVESIGRTASTQGDDIYVNPPNTMRRSMLSTNEHRRYVSGDEVRDWHTESGDHLVFPYKDDGKPISDSLAHLSLRFLWQSRTTLANTLMFGGKTKVQAGMKWFEYGQWLPHRFRTPLSITYGEVATHNHFVLDRGGKVFNRTAPVIKLPEGTTAEDHLTLLGLLNSSTACFWMKQVCHQKQMMGGDGIRIESKAKVPYAFNGTALGKMPIPSTWVDGELRKRVLHLSQRIDDLTQQFASFSPDEILSGVITDADSIRSRWKDATAKRRRIRSEQVFLQEQLDFATYRMFDLVDDSLVGTEVSFTLEEMTPGDRPFCMVVNNNEDGFAVPDSIPNAWSQAIQDLWSRRIEAIRNSKELRLIESSMYKRRWIGRQGLFNHQRSENELADACQMWLVNRLESYFDLDGRMNDEGKPTAKFDVELISIARLADAARHDSEFMEVGQVYRDDPAFDVQRLVVELVQGEQVPLLPVLRYKPAGLRKRAEWENTWQLQRLEDKLRAGEEVSLADYDLTDEQRQQIAKWQTETPQSARADDRNLDAILAIPVPPKYTSGDFLSSGGARYWALRGKLDVPKERWISFPHCDGPDGTLMLAWAGYNHLQQAQAISAYFVDVQERHGGRDDPRLVPLLASIVELLPWLKQWHHEVDETYGQRMDEVFEGFVAEEAKGLGMTVEEVRAWVPAKKAKRGTKKANS
ncbi:BREX-2 system adenine-specific DNA-methyltransferase PglX [Blastopirellula sp. JC732]|uniref:site-specific DNA-methyltransferase (adenine-specific) n=1 Tax=Blastopirellula sediminis TaxID=2894196 RepID=A0A9X1MK86_9BACT|nr:BREX-2 system adenine-specific DNA-methyltransferase PglX [Blastopirellula sediminis]MCC9608565.1 BREX-2 system adenine-specific DNA-methyltransferase PglX [Blastopirellula sediminis]MCC9628658.1 BREX-2 system adenine-specific DNA-methyltransferase PglX [Blastopirellula sediminis]